MYRSADYRVVAVNAGEVKRKLSDKGGYRSARCRFTSRTRVGQRRVVCVAAKRRQRRCDTKSVHYASSSYKQIRGFREQRWMSPVHVEVGQRVRDGSVVKGGKNAAGEVIIGGRRLKICPKTVRECKLAVPNAQ